MNAPNDRASLIARWDSLVSENPDAAALLSADGAPTSRTELDSRARVVASDLRDAGLSRGDVLLMSAPNGPDWMAAFLAAWRLGAVIAPIDADTTPERVDETAARIGATAIYYAGQARATGLAQRRRFRDGEIALGKLTSGSTGLPKPFFFRASQAISDGARIVSAMEIRPEDVNFGLAPWGHSYGLGNIVFPLLIQGTATTWGNTAWPHDLARSIQRTRATILPVVPTVLRALCETAPERDQFASLRFVLSAGARLEPEIARRFKDLFGMAPRNLYGSSETGGICYDATGDCALEGRSVGAPLPGVRLKPGPGGRIYCASDAVYTKDNRRARGGVGEVLLADRGRILPNGELELLGRAGRFAKIGGKRVSLPEVERRLRAIEGVEDAFASEVQARGEPVLAAALQSARGEGELAAAIRAALPRPLRPRRLIAMPRFPVNARGKTDTARLAAQLGNSAARDA